MIGKVGGRGLRNVRTAVSYACVVALGATGLVALGPAGPAVAGTAGAQGTISKVHTDANGQHVTGLDWSNGKLYVAANSGVGSAGTICSFDTANTAACQGIPLVDGSGNDVYSPYDVKVGPDGLLYFTSPVYQAGSVERVDPSGASAVQQVASTYSDGTSFSMSTGGWLAFDDAGNLYVSPASVNDPPMAEIDTTAIGANGVGSAVALANSSIQYAGAHLLPITTDGTNLYVAAQERSQAYEYVAGATTGFVAVSGNSGTPAEGLSASSVQFVFPDGIVADAAGNLFLTADGNTAEQVWEIYGPLAGANAGTIHLIAGTDNGTPIADAPDGTAATDVTMSVTTVATPMAVDSAGDLYFADGSDVYEIFGVAATTHSLAVSVANNAGDGAGTLTCEVDGGSSGPCASEYLDGSTVTITATPDDAATYTQVWGNTCPAISADGTQCTVTVNADTSLSVEFAQYHTLTVATYSTDGIGSGDVVSTVGSIACPDAVVAGGTANCVEKVPYTNGSPTQVELNADMATGSYLAAWMGCDDNMQVTCTATMNADKTVTASFEQCPNGLTCEPFTGPDTSFSGICPAGGNTAGGTEVTLTGQNLVSTDQVLFDGVPASVVSAAGDGTSLTVNTPAHAAGLVDVTIQGVANDTGHFTYENAPAHITGISPGAVYHVNSPPVTVTLTGTNLFDVTEIDTGSSPATNVHPSCDGTSVTFTPADDTTVADTSQSVFVTTAAGAADNTVDLGRADPFDQGPTSGAYSPVNQFLLDSNSANTSETLSYAAADGTSVIATIPADDLPVGTRIDIYKVDGSNAAITSHLPAGSVVQDGYAIAWTAPDGSHPVPDTPLDVEIDDPSIQSNQTVYAAGDDDQLQALALTASVPAGVNKLAIVSGSDQHIVKLIDVTPGETISGGQVIAAGGGNVIAAGGGNVIAAGGGNLVLAGGFVIAAGGGNVIAAGGGNVIAAGGGNVIAAGGGNFSILAATSAALAQINATAAGVIAAGGGNLADFNIASMIDVSGSAFSELSMPGDPQVLMVQAPTAPDAPGVPSVSVSGTDATVSWAASAASDPAVSAYAMQIFTDGVQTANVVFADASTTQTITNLARGHSYAFTVEAYNGSYSAASAKSASVSIPALGGGGVTSSGVSRLAGSTRIGTAIAVSQQQYSAAKSASAVVLARADVFADALAGGPLAAKVGGPLLLTGSASLDASTSAEIQRVLPAGGTVYVLGGENAISSTVDTALQTLGYQVKRLAGSTRAGTAVEIAKAIGDPGTVFLVTGANFPDGLAAGPAAITSGGVVLLTDGATMDPTTATYLATLSSPSVTAVGGPACQADPQAACLKGADRYATAEAVAAAFFTAATSVGVATGADFPDALAAVPYLGATNAPLLLVQPSGALPAPVTTYLSSHDVSTATIFGGTAAISDDVLAEITSVTGG